MKILTRKTFKNFKTLFTKNKSFRKLIQPLNPKPENTMEDLPNSLIEPISQMYEKIVPPIKGHLLKPEISANGMNPLNNFKLINYDFNIHKIIEKEFEKSENLNNSVVNAYLKTSANKINRFNHSIN